MFILPIFILITISSTAITLDIQKKIVGGVYSKHGEFPYLVSIQYLGLHLCGGSIINERQVLTAAHCFFLENGTALNISNMNIMAGRNELISNTYAFYTKINQTKLHPKYKQFDFDIAIIELNNSLPIGHPNISTINLEDTNPVNGTNCTAAGWGYDGKVEAVSNRLRVANVTIMNNRTCFIKYSLEDIILQPDIICAGDSERDSCQGDSGGPLVCSKKLVGIISSGVGCAYANYPGLYTSVAYHRRWIEENTKNRTKNVIDHPIITPPVDNNVNITNTNHTTNITNTNHTINATDRPVVFNPHGYAHNGTPKPPKRSGVSDLRPSTIIFFLLCLLMSSIKRFD